MNYEELLKTATYRDLEIFESNEITVHAAIYTIKNSGVISGKFQYIVLAVIIVHLTMNLLILFV